MEPHPLNCVWGLSVPERSVARGDTHNVLRAGPGWAVQVLLGNAAVEGGRLRSPRSGYGSVHLSSNPARFSLFLLPLLKAFGQVTFCQHLTCLLCSYLAYLSAFLVAVFPCFWSRQRLWHTGNFPSARKAGVVLTTMLFLLNKADVGEEAQLPRTSPLCF